MTPPPNSYQRHLAGIEEAVATCPPTPNHAALIHRLRRESALENARLATTRGDRWLVRRKVLAADGTMVDEDHETWLAAQVAFDGGDVRVTFRRLQDAGYQVSRCGITTLYVVAAGQSDLPSNFLQAEIYLENEVLERDLFDPHPWRIPTNLDELQRSVGDGPALPDAERRPVRPLVYQLRRIVDVEAWLQAGDALEEVRREAFRDRRYKVTSSSTPSAAIQTPDQLWPGWDRFPAKHRRFFNDWARSSASKHRLCDHWVFDLTDWTDASGRREMSLIPMWAFNRPLAKVDAGKGCDHEFYGRLQKLERRVGVPFSWFFYMLHGNRIEAAAGDRVIRAAEAGTIVLPEQDYRVLKDWESEPYAF
ncbi:hypothetical protein [Rhodanobacter sp. FW106-PBR-R2A-1-13]|uniref:hypothetical protein n=1 Tax=Rhodanobacter sp. FW106-PBR-R2A-1-13 TaxID=3454845 RepID=UPI0034E5BCF3